MGKGAITMLELRVQTLLCLQYENLAVGRVGIWLLGCVWQVARAWVGSCYGVRTAACFFFFTIISLFSIHRGFVWKKNRFINRNLCKFIHSGSNQRSAFPRVRPSSYCVVFHCFALFFFYQPNIISLSIIRFMNSEKSLTCRALVRDADRLKMPL